MKTVMFILSQSPGASDLNYQYARMALAICADAKPVMVLARHAVKLAAADYRDTNKHIKYGDQERFLVEMEVPFYAVEEDLARHGVAGAVKSHVQSISQDALAQLVRGADVVFN
jgi:hypothetical protein